MKELLRSVEKYNFLSQKRKVKEHIINKSESYGRTIEFKHYLAI